jgi:hypothetical protein
MVHNKRTNNKTNIHQLYREIININLDCKKILFSNLVDYDEIISTASSTDIKEVVRLNNHKNN